MGRRRVIDNAQLQALMDQGMSDSEIAAIMGFSRPGIENARYRLRHGFCRMTLEEPDVVPAPEEAWSAALAGRRFTDALAFDATPGRMPRVVLETGIGRSSMALL